MEGQSLMHRMCGKQHSHSLYMPVRSQLYPICYQLESVHLPYSFKQRTLRLEIMTSGVETVSSVVRNMI